MKHFCASLVSSVLLISSATWALPEETTVPSLQYSEQCADQIKECFASTETERSGCFFTSAQHPFCEGTALGKLSYQRWSMSPNKPGGLEVAPEFLGPRLVNGECLKNFDSEWSSALIKGGLTQKRMDELSAALEACAKDVSNELMRP